MNKEYLTIYKDDDYEFIFYHTEQPLRILFMHGDSGNDYYLNDDEYCGIYQLIEHIIYRVCNPEICSYVINEILKLIMHKK